jgi:hypothetical protein
LLRGDARRLRVVGIGIGADEIARVPTSHAGGLHAAARGEVGGAKGEALHARACAADLFDVDHALGGFEDCVHEERFADPGFGFELGEQLVDVVNVPGARDRGNHDDVEPVADLAHEAGQVVENPGAVEAVDTGPELTAAEVGVLGDFDQALASRHLVVDLDRIFQIAEHDVAFLREIRCLGHHLLVARVKEMDHPRGPEGDLARRIGCANRLGPKEVSGSAHRFSPLGLRR